jgi:hypothetical protein
MDNMALSEKKIYKEICEMIKDLRLVNRRRKIGFFDYKVQGYLYVLIRKGENTGIEIIANSFATDLNKGKLYNAIILIREYKNGKLILRRPSKEEEEYWTDLRNIARELYQYLKGG